MSDEFKVEALLKAAGFDATELQVLAQQTPDDFRQTDAVALRLLLARLLDLQKKLAQALVFHESISLAIEERTGQPPPESSEYIEVDAVRAREIMLLYPRERP